MAAAIVAKIKSNLSICELIHLSATETAEHLPFLFTTPKAANSLCTMKTCLVKRWFQLYFYLKHRAT